jgi:hypothetical protein
MLFVMVFLAASACLYLWFRRSAGGKAYWLTVAGVAMAIAILRIGSVTLGWHLMESSGQLQVLGYFMSLCGLPEAVLMPRPPSRSAESLGTLAVLLVAGSAAWVFAVALAARAGRRS